MICAGIMLVLFAFWWLTLEPPGRRHRASAPWWASLNRDDRDRSANRAKLVSLAAVLTVCVALAMLAAPADQVTLRRRTCAAGEAVGHLSYRGTWMYVTDGGHYDNLGLVEALRRGARHIVLLDASGDKANTWFTLGGSMALARSDAGVDIALNPTTMVASGASLAPGQVVRPWAHGTFSRPPGNHGLPEQGDIWVCKLGWWADAPWDVLAYAKGHPTFPCDSTLEQLYDAAEFEAYRELGEATLQGAARECTPPLRPAVIAGS